MITGGGYVAIGLVIGLVAGFVWGAIRQKKGKNKDLTFKK